MQFFLAITDFIAAPSLEIKNAGHTVKGETLEIVCSVRSIAEVTSMEFLAPYTTVRMNSISRNEKLQLKILGRQNCVY